MSRLIPSSAPLRPKSSTWAALVKLLEAHNWHRSSQQPKNQESGTSIMDTAQASASSNFSTPGDLPHGASAYATAPDGSSIAQSPTPSAIPEPAPVVLPKQLNDPATPAPTINGTAKLIEPSDSSSAPVAPEGDTPNPGSGAVVADDTGDWTKAYALKGYGTHNVITYDPALFTQPEPAKLEDVIDHIAVTSGEILGYAPAIIATLTTDATHSRTIMNRVAVELIYELSGEWRGDSWDLLDADPDKSRDLALGALAYYVIHTAHAQHAEAKQHAELVTEEDAAGDA